MHVKKESETNYYIGVEGIPTTGAKSRVETQIKLTLSLLSKNNDKLSNWSYLRIPDHLLAGSKLRKSQQQRLLHGTSTMVSDEILDLEARVVCESDETKRIKMCQGCVRRERKRAERKKDAKSTFEELNVTFLDEAFERDRKRVLLFNTEHLVSFHSGKVVLPTRITCYCRHHNERIGFRVRFTLRNKKGILVATGDSPPIMITDDHKTTTAPQPSSHKPRQRRQKKRPSSLVLTESNNSRSSSSSDDLMTPVQTPHDSPTTLIPILVIPILNTVFPSSGPVIGGTEITITGDHFHPGLTLMFGHRPAQTISCTTHTMVCLLPLAEASGPVVLSFKEHPLMRASPIPPMFEYSYEDDMAILNDHPITNLRGQTVLHYAALLGDKNTQWMSMLVSKYPMLVNAQDVNGLSPLHIACNVKSTLIIEVLLKAGADIGLMSPMLGTPLQMTLEQLSAEEYCDFEKRLVSIQHNSNTLLNPLPMTPPSPISWLPDLFVYACFQQQHNEVYSMNLNQTLLF